MRRAAPCYGRGVSRTKRWASVLVVSAFSLGLGACGEDLDDVVSNTPCGDDNQACCPGTTCFHGGQCLANVCRKPVARPSNECRSGDGCPSNGVCGGIYDCNGARACFLCESARATAIVPYGGPCMESTQCTTNLCIQGRCTTPCRDGAEGITFCRGQAGATGAEVCATVAGTFRGMPGTAPTTLSFCARRCVDNPEQPELGCPEGFRCVGVVDGLRDRQYGICLVPPMTPGGP